MLCVRTTSSQCSPVFFTAFDSTVLQRSPQNIYQFSLQHFSPRDGTAWLWPFGSLTKLTSSDIQWRSIVSVAGDTTSPSPHPADSTLGQVHSDVCPTGHYCPEGSAKPSPCPPGRKSTHSEGSDNYLCYHEHVAKQKSMSPFLLPWMSYSVSLTSFYYTATKGRVTEPPVVQYNDLMYPEL